MISMAVMTLGEKIKMLRERLGLSPEKLGYRAEISGIYIRKLEQGQNKSITLETARKLARALQVEPSVLIDEDAGLEQRANKPENALADLEVSIRAYIPVYAEVSAGEGIEPIDYLAVTRSRPAPDTLRAYRVKGLCLIPKIDEGDTVLVDTDLEPDIGKYLICLIDGQASIKRLCVDKNGEKYLENNFGSYKPEDCHVHGVVVGVYKNM